MASKGTRISDAAENTALTGTEKFPISDGSGDAKAVTANTIKQFVGSASGDGKVKDVQVDGTSVLDETSGVANINLSGKVDKEKGKGLSANDYTSAEKSKLAGIATGATVGATPEQASTIAEHTDQLAEITPKISDLERKSGDDILHVITAEEAAAWNADYGMDHYAAGDSLLEIDVDTPVRYINWNDKTHKLHVEQISPCHNEITIYAIDTSTLCIDDLDKIGDIISPSEDKKVAYIILDGIIVCGEITQP